LARIAGVDLPRDKKVKIGLTYIYGIGQTTALKVLEKANVDPEIRVKDLSDEDIRNIRNIISNELKVEGALRTDVQMNIKRLIDIGCYRGLRHRRGLPVRGQRTKTNARTRKGPRRTISRKKKKVGKKG
jgi:small subunit ribosomal protein S13